MAAGEPDLTLEEIDALIDAAPEPRILIVAHLDLVHGPRGRSAPEDP